MPAQGLGYAVSLAGFFLYNYIKMQKAPERSTTPLKHGDYTAGAQRGAEAQNGDVWDASALVNLSVRLHVRCRRSSAQHHTSEARGPHCSAPEWCPAQKANVTAVPAEATTGGLSRMLQKHKGSAAVNPGSAEYSIPAWTGSWNRFYCKVTVLLHRAWEGNVLGLAAISTCMAASGTCTFY